jgi:FAD/FMN-containing dehydrogenase
MALMERVKGAFDPDWILNPGKIVDDHIQEEGTP